MDGEAIRGAPPAALQPARPRDGRGGSRDAWSQLEKRGCCKRGRGLGKVLCGCASRNRCRGCRVAEAGVGGGYSRRERSAGLFVRVRSCAQHKRQQRSHAVCVLCRAALTSLLGAEARATVRHRSVRAWSRVFLLLVCARTCPGSFRHPDTSCATVSRAPLAVVRAVRAELSAGA